MGLETAVMHAEALLAAFGGSAEGWSWTGEIVEQDPRAPGATPCACGHTGLRYLFPWQHAAHTRRVITGSVCVDAVPALDERSVAAMRQALEALMAKRRAAVAAARRASKEAEVRALCAQVEAEVRRRYGRDMDAVREGWVPPAVYGAAREGYRLMGLVRAAGRLKSVAGQMRRLGDLARSVGVQAA